jgi:hypothetical protein
VRREKMFVPLIPMSGRTSPTPMILCRYYVKL